MNTTSAGSRGGQQSSLVYRIRPSCEGCGPKFPSSVSTSQDLSVIRGQSLPVVVRSFRHSLNAPLPDGCDCKRNGEQAPSKMLKGAGHTPEAEECIKLVQYEANSFPGAKMSILLSIRSFGTKSVPIHLSTFMRLL